MTDVSGTGGHSVADVPENGADGKVKQTEFCMVPVWIADLGWKAIVTYYALGTFANGRRAHPKHRTLAERAGVGVSTVREGIALLHSAGAIEVHDRWGPDGSRLSNDYVLHIDPPRHATTPSVATTPPVAPVGVAPPVGQRAKMDQSPLDQTDVPGGTSVGERQVRPEVTELCALLATHVEAVTGARPVVTKTWERDMRLTLERPRGTGEPWTAEQVEYVIRWLGRAGERSQFWSVNVRCPSKLRAQMDRLVLEIRSERRGPSQASRIERIRNLDPSTLQAGNPFERALAKARGQVTA